MLLLARAGGVVGVRLASRPEGGYYNRPTIITMPVISPVTLRTTSNVDGDAVPIN